MQLHLVQSSLSCNDFVQNLERYAVEGDLILFLNDSAFSLTDRRYQSIIDDCHLAKVNLSALKEQIEARAIEQWISSKIERLSYPEFVEISLSADKVISW